MSQWLYMRLHRFKINNYPQKKWKDLQKFLFYAFH